MASGRTSGANTTPLGRPNPALLNPKQTSSSSLLKPSYMSQPGGKRDREDEYEFLERSVLGYPDAASFDRVWGSRTSPNMFSISRMSEVKSSMPDEDFSISAVRLAFEESTNWPPESTSWPPDGQDRKKKKRSRWGGDDKEKVFIPGLPTVLPNNLNPQQERAYLLQLQIEEISRRLRTGDLGIPPNPEDRSPSPEPIYNSEGKRLNTREYRTRKKLEDDRHSLIQEMYSCNPDYKPPADYKPPLVKVSEKVMIPQEEHPDINFVGLLIGPRGNTLKAMEKETGAKIIIRGKGSVKEGKVGRKDGQPLPGEDEPLHAFVTGNSNESVKKAVNKIREIIRQGVEVPEGQNDLRRMQLRELALLNGTLRENDGPRCTNCGATTHRSWQCPDKPNVTNNVICTNCGGAGHIAKDCREQKKVTGPFGAPDKSKIDEEYMSLMAELGEGPPPPTKLTSIGTSQSTGTPLAAPPGPPRAIMAPPSQQQFQVTTVSTQSPWSGNVQNKPTIISSGPPPATVLQSSVFVPSPIMSQSSHNSAAQSGMPPWQQTFQAPNALQPTASAVLTTQGVSPVASMLAQPPPPPPPTGSQTHTAVSASWLATHQSNVAQGIPTSPWQVSPQQPGSGPLPVPPPGVTAIPPPAVASVYPWANFMGVPPPPPIQTTVQTLAAAPPPPPPTSNAVQTASTTSSVTQSVDLSALALPNLLTAPPPPPPS